jgi:hypothetical protein
MKSLLDTKIDLWQLSNLKRFEKKSLWSGTLNGVDVMVSYFTIIAEKREGVWYFTDEKYSVTTSKHVSFLKNLLGK